jgi:hypothetical protein
MLFLDCSSAGRYLMCTEFITHAQQDECRKTGALISSIQSSYEMLSYTVKYIKMGHTQTLQSRCIPVTLYFAASPSGRPTPGVEHPEQASTAFIFGAKNREPLSQGKPPNSTDCDHITRTERLAVLFPSSMTVFL